MDPTIPCKICSDKSAGVHYGVASCEACKSFFKRCNQKPPEGNKCRKPGYCTIVPARRNNCAECRYIKCLAVGMSINNIKTGRYSAKQLEESRREVEKLQRQRELEKNGFYANHTLKNEDIEKIVKTLVEKRSVIKKTFNPQLERFAIPFKVNRQNHHRPMRERLTASWKFRKPEVFKTIVFQVTQDIPGFSSLTQEDQNELIKVNRVDFRMIYSLVKVEDSGKYLLFNDKIVCAVEDVRKTEHLSEEVVERIRNVRKKLDALQLTDEERVVLSGLTLTHTDRSMKVEDRVSIEKIQNTLLQCLEYCVGKQYDSTQKGKRVAKLLTVLADLRTCSDDLIQSKHNLLFKYPDVDFPPSIREMWYSDLQEAYDMDKIRSELQNIDLDFVSENSSPEMSTASDLIDLGPDLETFLFDTTIFPDDIDTVFK
ncbi:DgyrCDS1373 [Dimorphilus gyrociliatus]|uniref:DgyrCDS1373 n=1 Tax=Dimorphilus gyrociliatus TaxID=2664684 RepID=A0A7I8V8L8_9ANNE|nr:DgyrCDS1373 [Dimorphilus gyrociliatus]